MLLIAFRRPRIQTPGPHSLALRLGQFIRKMSQHSVKGTTGIVLRSPLKSGHQWLDTVLQAKESDQFGCGHPLSPAPLPSQLLNPLSRLSRMQTPSGHHLRSLIPVATTYAGWFANALGKLNPKPEPAEEPEESAPKATKRWVKWRTLILRCWAEFFKTFVKFYFFAPFEGCLKIWA